MRRGLLLRSLVLLLYCCFHLVSASATLVVFTPDFPFSSALFSQGGLFRFLGFPFFCRRRFFRSLSLSSAFLFLKSPFFFLSSAFCLLGLALFFLIFSALHGLMFFRGYINKFL